jgi:hypothetical protein
MSTIKTHVVCTNSIPAITVHAHAKPAREVSPEPTSGPTIWPSEKAAAIKLLSELTAASADSPHECIMSSITGVIDIDSPARPTEAGVTAAALCE